MTRILVIGLGGTIAMSAPATGDAVTPAYGAAHLLKAAPTLAKIAEIRTLELGATASANLTLSHARQLATIIAEATADGVTGAVVLMGTDALEELAFALDLISLPPIAIVFTGAARSADQIGADGIANIAAAVRVAADPSARDMGVLVAFNDEIHAARFVRKAHTMRTDAFSSEPFGPLGLVAEGRVRWALRPASPQHKLTLTASIPLVPILHIALGTTSNEVAALARDADALVVAALGGGHVPENLANHLGACAERMPVALSSRIGVGPGLERTYGYPGSETDLIARGLIATGLLGPQRARIVLQFLLSTGAKVADVRRQLRSIVD